MQLNIEQLKDLIVKGESETVEFKKSTAQLKPAIESLCAFLNGCGGTVLIGVLDNGKMVGQDVTDATRKEIAKEINKIEPSVQITTSYISLNNGKMVIALQANAALYQPYVYESRPFKRNQSTTSRMSQHQYEQLLIKRNHLNYAWDETPAVGYDIKDLDAEEIFRTVRQGIESNRIAESALKESVPDILSRLKLFQDGCLVNTAVLLFCKEARPNYPQFHIKMARFSGTTKTGEFIDNKSFHGNAFNILEEASNFLRSHLRIGGTYQQDSFIRLDKPTLPVLAVREAIINAIIHRDYSNRSSSISIAIYDDRLEIWSYGKLSNELTIDDLSKTHESHLRNKLVAELFYDRGFIEKWGTGITKMIDYCKADGIPVPEFTQYSGGLSVTFRFKDPLGVTTTVSKSFDELTKRQKEIMKVVIAGKQISANDIMNQIDGDITARTLRRDLTHLKSLGLIGVQGRANQTKWFVING